VTGTTGARGRRDRELADNLSCSLLVEALIAKNSSWRQDIVSDFDQIPQYLKPIIELQEVINMRVYWEQTGVLLPIYRLAGEGFSDADIANKLNITELKVQSCMAWLLRFLRLNYRDELVKYASSEV
jgi:hypothetical protein